jgi:transcriptional regulator with XRE-family HTH domain
MFSDPTQRTRFVLESLQQRGFSIREIARRSGLSRGEVFGILKGQHGTRAATTERTLANLSKDYTMTVLTHSGQRDVEPANADAYSRNGAYWNAIKQVTHSYFRDFSALRPFEGKYIEIIGPNGRERLYFVTDPGEIRRLASAGELDPVEITRGGSGKRRVR